MEIDTIKNITTIAAPLTKIVLDTFLVPKFKEIREKWNRDNKIIDHSFENKFQDYLNETFEKNAILNTLAFKKKKVLLNEVYVPLTLYNSELKTKYKIKNFDDNLFNESNNILITDTAGMGKSTLAKKLLVSCIEQNKGVPILIELRRLSRDKGIIDEIIEQLNPINDEINRQLILDLIKRGDFIFFLDGFDEISLTERQQVTKEIQRFISKARKNKFVITSRPEEALSSFGSFQKFQIKPLKPNEAFTLLEKYDNYGKISKLLISKLKEPKIYRDIEEYLTTPLLVSLLFTAFEHKQKIPFKKHIFYRQVYDALYESHDLSKGDSFERDKYSELESDDFHRMLRILGYLSLKAGVKIEFTKDELTDIIQKSINYCQNLDIKPADFIKDLLTTVPIFVKDGIYFKWAHKSLLEYFSAQFIYLDSKEKQKALLEHIAFHNNNDSFLNIIDLYQSMDPIGFDNVITYKLLKDYINFLNNTYKNFSGNDKLIRQQFAFTHELYLINFPFSPKTKENHPRELFLLLRKEIKLKYSKIGIRLNVIPDEKNISYIKVPEISNQYNTLINFYYDNGAMFIYKEEANIKKKNIDLKLKRHKIYKVTDRKNSILNKGENFRKTNYLIQLFLGHFSILKIDVSKAILYINDIENRLKLNKNNSLLDF